MFNLSLTACSFHLRKTNSRGNTKIFNLNMDMIRTTLRRYNIYSFSLTQHPQGFPNVCFQFSVNLFSAIFGCKHYMIFASPFRSVYKELHADHETGAADNK